MPEPEPRHPPAPAEQQTSEATATQSDGRGAGAGGEYPFLGPPERPGDWGKLGPYRVTGLLGSGGMGFVFRGEDDALLRPVALKVMRPEVAAHPSAHERFLREGRATAALRSDHVVIIYTVGEHAGLPFLAMELLEGTPLDKWLERREGRKGAPADAVRVAMDALRGLAVAHEKGRVHRDVKPSNLWVEEPSGRIKVLDFGLTRGKDDGLTLHGTVVGTPAYMSPEQADGLAVDARADLFSLGAVLYRVLTGGSPFARPEALAALLAVKTVEPPPLAALVPGVPAKLAQFVHRLLAKD
ncbi:MAG TPA: serine/threonine-protein kinase, partial [Gemmata sp.]